ncbi:hypothetical protein K1719_026329 [Acacia pycnantha]|nr:hypothetical protein K1719_026329 [Acacia pycnantha]
MSCLQQDGGGFFFVYGCVGTGKTFLWYALMSSLRAKGQILLIVASSRIAATLLPSSRTIHSRTLRDMIHCDRPFGGKCVIMGGDFRQILPIIQKGTRGTIVNACINSSYPWDHCIIFQLTKNMRLNSSALGTDHDKLVWFSRWLLDVGDGKLGNLHGSVEEIEIPGDLLISGYQNPICGINIHKPLGKSQL